jgi:hypothetical protein
MTVEERSKPISSQEGNKVPIKSYARHVDSGEHPESFRGASRQLAEMPRVRLSIILLFKIHTSAWPSL